ncbi:hypothetical protein DERF_001970 [Dermatophagoides farinae]|uniref:Uncharacterized protein n=1 Tax=Dermatophagoides farinae TaxID=6954 RepID=A0A922ICU6_DERFA|nr:hypothetical protein DERF_001970 [Dermatophagoides farinae]
MRQFLLETIQMIVKLELSPSSEFIPLYQIIKFFEINGLNLCPNIFIYPFIYCSKINSKSVINISFLNSATWDINSDKAAYFRFQLKKNYQK